MKIALYKAASGSMVDKVIDAWTGMYGYSHCEIVFDHIEHVDNDTYLCCSSSPRDGELRFTRIDIHSGHWEIIEVPKIYTLEQEQEIYDFLKKMEGAKYDWKGIFFSFIFAFVNKQNDDEWWCSEICAYVVDKFISPMQFRISPNKFAKKLKAPRKKFSFKFELKKSY